MLPRILIYSESFQEHILTMAQVFQTIADNGLTVRPRKNKIAFPEVSFLGYIIKQGYVATDDSVMSKIVTIEPP